VIDEVSYRQPLLSTYHIFLLTAGGISIDASSEFKDSQHSVGSLFSKNVVVIGTIDSFV
jgi:hypothetical protein